MSKRANLEKYSKADLIWIIRRMTPLGDSWELMRAISDLECEKERQRLDEAEKIAKIAEEKRQAYIELLAPYDGKTIWDVPHEVLAKADKAIKEAEAADRKWNRLMGIKEGGK